MRTYKIGDTNVRRKNLYRPCIMSEAFDKAEADGDRDEIARLLKLTDWCDSIAAAEWRAILQEPDCTPSAKSRFKRKAAGWIVALQHVARLYPELLEEIAAKAGAMHVEQFQQEPALLLVWDGSLLVSGKPTLVGNPVEWHPEES